MIINSTWHSFNNWQDDWSCFPGLTYEYWFNNFPSEIHSTIAENDNAYGS